MDECDLFNNKTYKRHLGKPTAGSSQLAVIMLAAVLSYFVCTYFHLQRKWFKMIWLNCKQCFQPAGSSECSLLLPCWSLAKWFLRVHRFQKWLWGVRCYHNRLKRWWASACRQSVPLILHASLMQPNTRARTLCEITMQYNIFPSTHRLRGLLFELWGDTSSGVVVEIWLQVSVSQTH